MKVCKTCNRPRHKGVCDMATLSDGTTVHTSRIDDPNGDVRARIEAGEVRVANRWIPKPAPKRKDRF